MSCFAYICFCRQLKINSVAKQAGKVIIEIEAYRYRYRPMQVLGVVVDGVVFLF